MVNTVDRMSSPKRLTTFFEPAARVLPLMSYVLLVDVVAAETVFTQLRDRVILQSGGMTVVTAPPACLEIQDVINSEFQRGGGSTWCVHFVHILRLSPFLYTSVTLPILTDALL